MRTLHAIALTSLCLAGPLVSLAGAVPVSLPLDTATSHLTFGVTINGKPIVSAEVPFVGGGLNATVNQGGIPPLPLDLTDISGEVDSGDVTIHTLLGNLSAKGLAIVVGPSPGPFAATGANPTQVNLNGLTVSIDQGIIDAGFMKLADFSRDPIKFSLPTTYANLSDDLLSLQLPVNYSDSKSFKLLGLNATVAYSLTGSINFAGAVLVPEPGTMALSLVTVALLGVPVARRVRVRRQG